MFSKHIIENNKTIEHILYLGEDKSKYYYILDETLNSIIYTDKNLAKEICIGEDDYNGHIKKLVFSNIIDNYMYQRVRKQDMQFLHEYQWFHDSFCKGEYPKFYNEENKTNLLLGTKSRKKYFYSQEQIERVVDNNSSICSLEKKVFLDNLLRNSLFDLEEPNEQEIKTRSQMKWKSVDDNEVVRVFCSVDINSSNLLNLKENKK